MVLFRCPNNESLHRIKKACGTCTESKEIAERAPNPHRTFWCSRASVEIEGKRAVCFISSNFFYFFYKKFREIDVTPTPRVKAYPRPFVPKFIEEFTDRSSNRITGGRNWTKVFILKRVILFYFILAQIKKIKKLG